MKNHSLWLSVLALALAAIPAGALPPPMSPQELNERSDVVATVKVLGVACTGSIEHESTREKLPTYQAWLQVVKVKKGTVKPGDTLLVGWHDISKKLIGPWKVEYLPGEEVETHLKWDAKARAYETTWWNARGEPVKAAERKTLPTTAGEVIYGKAMILSPAK